MARGISLHVGLNRVDPAHYQGWDGGGYAQFREAIRARVPAKQQPNYLRVGADNPGFEQQKPFTIG